MSWQKELKVKIKRGFSRKVGVAFRSSGAKRRTCRGLVGKVERRRRETRLTVICSNVQASK